MEIRSYIYQNEYGVIGDVSSNEIIEFLKEKITNNYQLNINKILIEPTQRYIGRFLNDNDEDYTCLFNISFTFLGTNQDGFNSIYTCRCKANYYLSKEELEQVQYCNFSYLKDHSDEEVVERLKRGTYKFKKDIDIKTINDSDISIKKIDCPPIKEILYFKNCDGDVEIIYQGDEIYNDWLYYLKFDDDEIEEYEISNYDKTNSVKWIYNENVNKPEIKNIIISDFIESNGILYVHPEPDGPEFDLEETPYFSIDANEKQISKIKDKTQMLNHANYYYYKEFYKDNKLLIYEIGNVYHMVTNPKLIYESAKEKNISELLHVNNYQELGITGKVKEIKPVMYGYHFQLNSDKNYEVNDDKKFIRSIGYEEGIDIDYKKDQYIYPANDLLIINMEDGSQGYMFLNIPLDEDEKEINNETSKAYVKRAIYLAPKNNKK